MSITRFVLLVLASVILVACQPAATSDPDPVQTAESEPPQVEAVERYIVAKSHADRDTMQGLICSALESTLDAESMSFSGIENEVVEMDCFYEEENGVVVCEGAIVAVYDGENTEFPLSSYSVVEEDGEWKWCGEA